MIIVIDIGNTNITFGVFKIQDIKEQKNIEPLFYGNIQTDKTMTTDELAIQYLNLKKLWGVDEADFTGKVMVSSVVPQLNYQFSHMFQKYYHTEPYFVRTEDIPLDVHYDYPEEIGADRIVNAYAGSLLFPRTNLIIVDFGTATTFDIMSEGRVYEGGLIMTGIMTSIRALEEKASKLPHIDLSLPSNLIAKNTVDGIRSGIINGNGAMVDELTKRIAKEMNWVKYKVLATGGLSQLIKSSSLTIDLIDQHLTLKGLYYLWDLRK